MEYFFKFAKFKSGREKVCEAFYHLFNGSQFNLNSEFKNSLESMKQKDLVSGVIRSALDAVNDPDDHFSISGPKIKVEDGTLDFLMYWDQDEFDASQGPEELFRVLKSDGILLVIEIENSNVNIHKQFTNFFDIIGIAAAKVGALAAVLHVMSGPVEEDFMRCVMTSDGEYLGTSCDIILLSKAAASPEMPIAPPVSVADAFYNWRDIFPELEVFRDFNNFSRILEEVGSIRDWKAWPESHYSEGGNQDWKVFPFLHCFPANDKEKMTWINSTSEYCPFTVSLLKTWFKPSYHFSFRSISIGYPIRQIPNIRTALFSRLGGNTKISSHRGWSDLANYVLRIHVTLAVPESKPNRHPPCGLWVEGRVKYHRQGKIIVFDDSKLHKAFNNSEKERLVLIIDVLRPGHIPKGTARKGMTPELIGFIQDFS